MKKMLLVVLILALISVGSIFAQSGEGFIKSTFGFGHCQVMPDSGDNMDVNVFFADLDFVNSFGLTIGIQGVMLWGGDLDSAAGVTEIPIGIGYTFARDKWCVGGKIMAAGFLVGGGAKAFGFEVGGSYWFLSDLGVSTAFNMYFPEEVTVWVLRAGISIRL